MEMIGDFFKPWFIVMVRYLLMAGIPFLIFYVLYPESFKKSRIQQRLARSKDIRREIWHSVQSTTVFALVAVILIKTPLARHTQLYTDVEQYPLVWLPLSLLIALVVHDAYFYWMHRVVHQPGLYRRIHLVHHKSVSPSPWASYSFHLNEALLEALIAPIIIFFIPIHPGVLIAFALISFAFNVYGHLGYEIAPRAFRHSVFFEFMATSTYHNLHHSRFRHNYGLYFRWWDRLMGTENPDYVEEYDRIQQSRFQTA